MIDTGRTIAEVAREIGVGEQLLGRWVAQERARDEDRSMTARDRMPATRQPTTAPEP